jgi:hypothetical protein
MRFDRDRLVFMALCVLNDVCWQSQRGQVQGTMSIRLALATLYGCSNGDMAPYREFWTQMGNECVSANSWEQSNTLRHSYTYRAFRRIAESVGVKLTDDYRERLEKMRPRGRPIRLRR